MFHADLGGSYLFGTRGSQEELYYRTSFIFTVPNVLEEFEFEDDGVAHSDCVVIVPKSFGDRHAWCDLGHSDALHVAPGVSLSANGDPVLTNTTPTHFANTSEREIMKKRWRDLLRLPGQFGHIRLVLGMLGCEHQHNSPLEKIAKCFKEVMEERQFKGS